MSANPDKVDQIVTDDEFDNAQAWLAAISRSLAYGLTGREQRMIQDLMRAVEQLRNGDR